MNNPLPKLAAAVKAYLTLIFGDISWRCPPWVKYLCHKASVQTQRFWGVLFGTLVLLVVLFYGYQLYQKRPQPEWIIAHVTTPNITPIAEELIPDTLNIDFGTETTGFTPKSVAPLKSIGKVVTNDITLEPAISGKWRWQTDSHLQFIPDTDWPPAQTYIIHFNKNFFTRGTPMRDFTYSFTTQPFSVNISDFRFYQDPVNPQLRQVVGTLHFNYPVDPASLENNISLQLQALKAAHLAPLAFKYTLNYDKFKRTVYLRSEALPLPDVERYLELTINKGVKALANHAVTAEAVTQTVRIPDAGSFLKITNSAATIVRNERDQPKQVLVVETSIGVKESEINKNIHVYLLPKDYPATAVESTKTDYAWQNPGEVTAAILASATPVALQPLPADRDFAVLHSFQFKADPSRYLYIKMDKGLVGFGNYVLTNNYAAIQKVPDYPKEIGFLHKGALLALTGEKKISVTVRGIPAVKFSIARVLPNDVNQLVTQTAGSFNDPYFQNYSFNENNISEIFSEIKQFDASDLAAINYSALDLTHYLGTKANPEGPQGLFLLHAQGWDTVHNQSLDVEAKRLVLITDLGLIVKDNQDGTHDLFVASITKGQPIANADVSILGKNGLPVVTRRTNAQGYASFPVLKEFVDEREPTVYLARLDSDVSFIPYANDERQLNYSRFDVGGVVTEAEQRSLSAFVFSDRGIYRPGETAHIATIIKQAYAEGQPAGLPLEITVTDSRGVTVREQKFTLDKSGYFAFDFKTQPNFATGQYTINLFIVKDNHLSNLLGSAVIRIAEFLPDQMRITTQLSAEATSGWITPENLKANVLLMNLYGAPAENRKVSGRILLTPQIVKFASYPNYIFADPLLDPSKPPKTYTDTLAEQQTDQQGRATFDLKLGRFDKATYQLTFFAEGFAADSGRSVTAQTTALVSPLLYFVGYKADGDLNYIQQNGTRKINYVAINPQLKTIPVTDLKLQVLVKHPITTLVKKADGTYQYQSLIQTSQLSEQAFVINTPSVDYTLPTSTVGDFAIVIVDKEGNELSHLNYTVVGNSQQPLPKNAELNIKLDKAEYLADQDIAMEITAPYTGSGLITIERDKVYAYQWFKTTTTSSIQKIHIPKEFNGGGYVNVAFMRDWDSPEIFMSPLSYSVVPFTVSRAEHALKINLNVPETAKPGESLTIQYQSDKPGKIIVFAVDEGILQVASYKTPDPLGFFFQKRALEVSTQQIVDQILPKFIAQRELSAVGGDTGGPELSKLLNPFKRKTDLPVVYWSGIVDTDTTPRQLTYQIPDYFNGTLRIMAVAATDNAVGATDQATQIRGNFVINPNAPTFVAPSDEFVVTASIANNVKGSGPDASVTIQMQTSPELILMSSARQTLKISEGQEQTVHFKLRAKPELGSAELTWIASIGNQASQMKTTISVRPATANTTTIQSGYGSSKTKTILVERDLYPDYRAVTAVISTSPLILIAGLERFLDRYPYGCTEQIVSQAFPLLAVQDQPWLVEDKIALAEKVKTAIFTLSQRQLSSGGFSYWPGAGNNTNNAFASVYAMHFLTEARSYGYEIPGDVFSNGIGYLKELAGGKVSSLDEARVQAYAIYILTRNEIVTSNYVTNLQLYLENHLSKEWHHDITNMYLAATYQLLKSYSDADKLLAAYQPLAAADVTESDFYNGSIAQADYLYLLARHFPDHLQTIGNTLVLALVDAMNTAQINTVFSSYASLALAAYHQAFSVPSGVAFGIEGVDVNQVKKPLAAPDSLYQKIALDDSIKQIIFSNPSQQTFFYQLIQSGFDKIPQKNSIQDNMEIFREYRDKEGRVVNTATLGEELEVHIQVRALNNQYVSNIAILDLLPGGFEAITDSINKDTIDYADIREDRVIFFTSISPQAKEIIYRIKPTNQGTYIVPPISALSMYNPKIQASSTTASITVGE